MASVSPTGRGGLHLLNGEEEEAISRGSPSERSDFSESDGDAQHMSVSFTDTTAFKQGMVSRVAVMGSMEGGEEKVDFSLRTVHDGSGMHEEEGGSSDGSIGGSPVFRDRKESLTTPFLNQTAREIRWSDRKQRVVSSNIAAVSRQLGEVRWSDRKQRVASFLIAAAGIGLRAADQGWTNVLGSCLLGASLDFSIRGFVKRDYVPLSRQMGFLFSGQPMSYVLSQVFDNFASLENPHNNHPVQRFCVDTILAGFGYNLSTFLHWGYQNRNIQRSTEQTGKAEKERVEVIPTLVADILKGGASVALLVTGLTQTSNPILRGFALTKSVFYAASLVGNKVSQFVQKKMSEPDSDVLSIVRGNRYFQADKFLNFFSMWAPVIAFVPWTSLDTEKRVKQLVGLMSVSAFFAGYFERSRGRRLEKKRIDELDEFKPIKNSDNKWVWLAPQIGTFLAVVGVSAWQMAIVDKISKVAVGTLLIGFTSVFAASCATHYSWRKNLHIKGLGGRKIKWLMNHFWFSHKYLGVDPLWIYLIFFNAYQMDNRAIQTSPSTLAKWMEWIAWGAYGAAMGREAGVATSYFKGGPEHYWPMMQFIGSVIMLYNIFAKKTVTA